MTLRFVFNGIPVGTPSAAPRRVLRRNIFVILLTALVCLTVPCGAQDVLVLSNGDTLHGKFVSAVNGKVTFHSDALGDLTLGWDKIKELKTNEKFAVLGKDVKLRGKKSMGQIPMGTMDVAHGAVTVHPENGAAIAPVPVNDAQFILTETELDKAVYQHQSLLAGWTGAATAGASVVTATQDQYTMTGGIGLVRVAPSVTWLNPRDRTSLGFTASFGKITQPGYFVPATPPSTTPALVPEVSTKSSIFHADAERDEYFSPRFFALGQVAFDHNFGQDLQLQQIYGGGLGWTAFKTARQEADLKGTMQYEKQQFITGSSSGSPNLIGSTFAASYALHLKLLAFAQGLAFVPAYNNPHAYSANETDTVSFPAYKNLSFSLGTMDSYLNNPPASLPPTKRNSFQFTMGLTYAIKAKD